MKYEVLEKNWGFGGNYYREKGEIVDLDPSINPPPKLFRAINQVENNSVLVEEAKEVPSLVEKRSRKKS